MKAAAAGKIEGRHNDAAARGYDGGFSCRQISGVENNERRILWRGIVRVGLVETAAFNAGSGKADVVWTPVLKAPSEDCGVELLRPLDVSRCNSM